MPLYRPYIDSYWCPGWWPWQWARMCEKEVWGWCYMFQPYEEVPFGAGRKVKGCEDGLYYEWIDWGLHFKPVKHWQPFRRCFETPMQSKGKCPDAFASQVFAVGMGGDQEQPAISPITQTRTTLQVTSAETGVYKYPEPTSERPSLFGPCRVGDWHYTRTLWEEEVALTVEYKNVQLQWSVGGTPVLGDSGIASLGALCSWPVPLPTGSNENRVVSVTYQLDNSQPGQSTLRLYNNPADGRFCVKVALTATAENQSSRAQNTSFFFEGEFCDFDPEQLEAEQNCLKRIPTLPEFTAPAHPTRWEIVSTPWDDLGLTFREEKHETVTLLLDIIKVAYGHDAKTFTWAADRLAQETGLSDIINRLKFEPVSRTVPAAADIVKRRMGD